MNLCDISNEIISQAYLKLFVEHMSSSQIHHINNIQFIKRILNLLSSNESISLESREIFSLLHNVFNKPILEAKETLQSIITAQDISPEVQYYKEKEASAVLFALNQPVIHP